MAVNIVENKLTKKHEGPIAVVRCCTICGFKTVVRKGLRNVGRGYGMREGNKARGELIQHIRREHPSEVAALTIATPP